MSVSRGVFCLASVDLAKRKRADSRPARLHFRCFVARYAGFVIEIGPRYLPIVRAVDFDGGALSSGRRPVPD